MINRVRRRLSVAIAGAYLSLPLTSFGDARPLKLVVGFPPGGTTDVIARLIALQIGQRLGRQVIVENRPGASGNIAALYVAKAPPDGSTFLFVPSSHATNPSLYSRLPFNTEADFAAVAMVAKTPYILVCHPSLPVNNVNELIEHLKRSPTPLQYATSSPGTGQHIAGELFKRMAGVELEAVPYKGSAAALPDLLAGRTPLMFDNIAVVQPHVQARNLKALAITSPKRSPLLPDLPAVAESLPGYEIVGWFALMAPSKIKPELIAEMQSATLSALGDKAVVDRFADLGAEVFPADARSADAFIASEIRRFSDVIHAAGITIE